MTIIERDVYEPSIHCPSSRENILKPREARFNKSASALKGSWSFELADEPYISHPDLQDSWSVFYERFMSRQDDMTGMMLYEAWIRFLKDLDEPGWMAYELTFHGMGCGPVSFTRLYVVEADTVVDDLPGELIRGDDFGGELMCGDDMRGELMRGDDMDDAAFCDEATDGRSGGGVIWRVEPFDTFRDPAT